METFLYLRVAFVVVLSISSFRISLCAAPKKVAAAARREDIPFIKCQVCEKFAQQIHQQVRKKQEYIAPQKVPEIQIIEIVENLCNLKKQEADWILQIDIVEKGDALELVDQGTEGQCNSECKTIEQACQQVMGYSDTDIAEYVYTHRPSIDALVNYVCYDLTKACSAKPPPVPKNRIPGEAFVPKSSKEAEMDRLLKSMEGMPGAPNMKMYSREDLMNMDMNNFREDDEEDEDDEDDKFTSQLGKVLREKASPKKDLKHKILQSIQQTGDAIKKHATRVSSHVRKWWREKKTTSKYANTGQAEL